MVERFFQTVVSPGTVSAASAWAREVADELRLSSQDAYRVDLVVTEIVQNLFDHADPASREVPLTVHLRADGQELRLSVIDEGPAFDPLAVPLPAQPEDIGAASLGGLGIHLVREFSEQCSYARRGESNCLEAVFVLERPGAKAA